MCIAFFLVFFFSPIHFSKHRGTVRIFNLGQMCLLILDVSYLITAFRRLLSWIGMAGLMSQEVFTRIFPCSWIWCWVSLLRDGMCRYILINTTFRAWNCCRTISYVVLTIFWVLQNHIFMANFLKFVFKRNSAYLKMVFKITYLLGCSCHLCFHLGICQ